MDTTEAIDLEGLKRMSGNDEQFVKEILRLYQERATKDLKELDSARTISDFSAIRFVIHRMRSAAVPLGLKSLVVILKKVEMQLKEESNVEIESYLDQIYALTRSAVSDATVQLNRKVA